MSHIFTSFLLAFIIQFNSCCYAQNYYYIHGEISEDHKINIGAQLKGMAEMLEIHDATIALMKCDLPLRINATLEFDDNEIVQRKMFLIRINANLPVTLWAEVISHEMIHVHQYYHKTLIRHSINSFTWKGKRYTNIHRIEHHKRPWEAEAIQCGRLLLNLYTASWKAEENTLSFMANEFP